MGLFRLGALVLTLLCTGAAVVAVDWETVQIETSNVAPGIFMLKGRGGNIGASAGPDGIFLVDDQFAPLTEKIASALKRLSEGRVRFVLNTHYHRDHTDGNEKMGQAGSVIVAHDNVRERLSVEDWVQSLEQPTAGLPIVTFTDAVTFHLNGDAIHVFHVSSAHTDGDSMVHFRRANVIHMGDVYFNGLYPFIDVEGGGSVDGVIAATERVLALADNETRIIPGHGPLSNREELLFYRDMLRDIRDRVDALLREGKNLEQIQFANPSAQYDEKWGGDFISPDELAEAIYSSLKPEGD